MEEKGSVLFLQERRETETSTGPHLIAEQVDVVSPEPAAEAATEEVAPHPMDQLLAEAYGFRSFKRGDILEGVVVSVTPTEILVDIGSKTEGIISGRELERMGAEAISNIQVGDEVLTYVINPESKDGNVVLSLTRAQLEKDWRAAEEMFEKQEVLERSVAGYNKGGLIVRIGKVRGFVPGSQIVSVPPGNGGTNEERWAKLVGQSLMLKIIELDRKRNRLILSERAAMREWRKAQKERLLDELQEGEVRRGRVSSLCDFGAFIDLGGADGLVHLSELSWGRVKHPNEVLNVGDEVDVHVLSVDRQRKRIALSLKRLQPEPWSTTEEIYRVGQLVQGTITKLTNFGAFARIDEYIEGLIHLSELSDKHITHPKEVVKEGEEVTLRIIRIDARRRRMGLSLKRVNDPEYADIDWQAELLASQAEEEEDREKLEAEAWPDREEITPELAAGEEGEAEGTAVDEPVEASEFAAGDEGEAEGTAVDEPVEAGEFAAGSEGEAEGTAVDEPVEADEFAAGEEGEAEGAATDEPVEAEASAELEAIGDELVAERE